MDSGNNEGALAGLRVLDLTRILAGPLCGQMLGDMGVGLCRRAHGEPVANEPALARLDV